MTKAHEDEMRKVYEDTIGITSCMRGEKKMVDFSDITNEDMEARWKLLCEQEKQEHDELVARYPALKGLEFKPTVGTVDDVKRALYTAIRMYEKKTLFPFSEEHTEMQKLHDNLKSQTL
jgi:hypothetical protein